MPTKASRPNSNELAKIIERLDISLLPGFVSAMNKVVIAIDYDDNTLVRSHLNEALESLRDSIQEQAKKQSTAPASTLAVWREVLDILRSHPIEPADAKVISHEFNTAIEKVIESTIGLRDGIVRTLRDKGYSVDNAIQLDKTIEELQQLKTKIFNSWPWSNQEALPVDRIRVEKSSEGENVNDLIQRIRDSKKDANDG